MASLTFNEIIGTTADDQLNQFSGTEHYILRGLAGNDLLNGGSGHDYLYGGPGEDRVNGGDGNDHIYGFDLTGDVSSDLGDNITAGVGSDYVQGNAGDDTIRGNAGDDRINGGADNDDLFGDEGNDTINGNKGNDIIEGNDGSDCVRGGQGNDFISGNDGNDIVMGDLGSDTLSGNAGSDTLTGGEGNDLFLFGVSQITSSLFSYSQEIDAMMDFDDGSDHIRLVTKAASPSGYTNLVPNEINRGPVDGSISSVQEGLTYAKQFLLTHQESIVALQIGDDTHLFYKGSFTSNVDGVGAVTLLAVQASDIGAADFV